MDEEVKQYEFDNKLYPNKGEMPSHEDPHKPICFHCKSKVWVMPAGRTDGWHWYCTKCVQVFNPPKVVLND